MQDLSKGVGVRLRFRDVPSCPGLSQIEEPTPFWNNPSELSRILTACPQQISTPRVGRFASPFAAASPWLPHGLALISHARNRHLECTMQGAMDLLRRLGHQERYLPTQEVHNVVAATAGPWRRDDWMAPVSEHLLVDIPSLILPSSSSAHGVVHARAMPAAAFSLEVGLDAVRHILLPIFVINKGRWWCPCCMSLTERMAGNQVEEMPRA